MKTNTKDVHLIENWMNESPLIKQMFNLVTYTSSTLIYILNLIPDEKVRQMFLESCLNVIKTEVAEEIKDKTDNTDKTNK